MIIKVEVSQAELAEMYCDSVKEFTDQLRHQLNDAVCDDAGGVGEDWMADYTLEVVVV